MEVKSDYLFILSPSNVLTSIFSKEKNSCFEEIGMFESRRSKAHITITNHFYRKNYEVEDLIPYLKKQAAKLPPIILQTSGYDFFENYNGTKKTIYGKIITNEFEEVFFDQLRDIVNGRSKIVPHITIAKDLSNEQFEKLWPIYQNKELNASFTADKLTVLRRNYLSDFIYENIAELEFKNDVLNIKHIYKNKNRRVTMRSSIALTQLCLF